MPITPGMALAAGYVFAVYKFTDSSAHAWLWISAIALSLVIDAMMGIVPKKAIDVPSRTVYERDEV